MKKIKRFIIIGVMFAISICSWGQNCTIEQTIKNSDCFHFPIYSLANENNSSGVRVYISNVRFFKKDSYKQCIIDSSFVIKDTMFILLSKKRIQLTCTENSFGYGSLLFHPQRAKIRICHDGSPTQVYCLIFDGEKLFLRDTKRIDAPM